MIVNPGFWAWLTMTSCDNPPPYKPEGYTDDDIKEVYEERLFSGLNRRVGLIKHECLHLVLSHLTRASGAPDKRRMEMAKEVEVNQWIKDNWLFPKDPTPEFFNLPEKLSCEEYYDLLPKSPEENGQGEGGEGQESQTLTIITQNGQGQGNGSKGNPGNGQGGKGSNGGSGENDDENSESQGNGGNGKGDKSDDNNEQSKEGSEDDDSDGNDESDGDGDDSQEPSDGPSGGNSRFIGLNRFTKDNHDCHRSHEQQKPEDGKDGKSPIEASLEGADCEETVQMSIDQIIQDVTEMMTEGNKNRGTVPGIAEALYEKIRLKSSIPWEQVLQNLMSNMTEVLRNKSFRRPSRRDEDIFPSRRRKIKYRFYVASDESGSVSSSEFALFGIEIDRIIEVNEAGVQWLHTDSSVGSMEAYDKWSKGWKRERSGGTDFQPTIDYCVENGISDLIYFTDGEAPIPDPKGVRLLWVFTPGVKPDTNLWGGTMPKDFPGWKCYMKPSVEQLKAAEEAARSL